MTILKFNPDHVSQDGINGLTEAQVDALAAQFLPEISHIIDRCYVRGNTTFQFTDAASTEIAEFLMGNGREVAVAIVAASTARPAEEVRRTDIIFLLPTLWLTLHRTFEEGASTYDIGETLISRLIQSAGRQSSAVAGGRVQ